MSEKHQSQRLVSGQCPSCKVHTTFQFIGVQEWHPEIAKKLNIPSRIRLYRCNSCDSSINEFALRDDSATAS